jgi:hypothetical protein
MPRSTQNCGPAAAADPRTVSPPAIPTQGPTIPAHTLKGDPFAPGRWRAGAAPKASRLWGSVLGVCPSRRKGARPQA